MFNLHYKKSKIVSYLSNALMINDPHDPLAWIENVYSVWKNQQHIYIFC